MKIWYSTSTEKKPCAVCGRQTGTSKVYEQSSITIYIPACDNVYENRYCYRKVDIKKSAAKVLKMLKTEISIAPKGEET